MGRLLPLTAGPAAGGAADANGAGRLGDGRLRCGSVLQPKRGRRRRSSEITSRPSTRRLRTARRSDPTTSISSAVNKAKFDADPGGTLRSTEASELRGRHGGRHTGFPWTADWMGPLRPEAGRTCVVCSPRLSVFLRRAHLETSLTHSHPLPTLLARSLVAALDHHEWDPLLQLRGPSAAVLIGNSARRTRPRRMRGGRSTTAASEIRDP